MLTYDKKAGKYVIREEQVGGTIDTQALAEAVQTAAEQLQPELDAVGQGLYGGESVRRSDDEKLNQALEQANRMLQTDVTYTFEVERKNVYGKERRKKQRGREGKLGVEGMPPQVLIQSLRRAGATFLDEEETAVPPRRAITKADLMALGLSGGPGAAERRKELLHRLELPERLSPNALLEVLNVLYDRPGFLKFYEEAT